MLRLVLRARAIVRDATKPLVEAVIGGLVVVLLRVTRHFDAERTAGAFARITRAVGPYLPEHKIGRANLKAAFPDKSDAEIEAILLGVWENLGRVEVDGQQIADGVGVFLTVEPVKDDFVRHMRLAGGAIQGTFKPRDQRVDGRQRVQGTDPGQLLAVFGCDLDADLARLHQLAVLHR